VRTRRYHLLIIALLTAAQSLYAQREKKSLQSLLPALEQRYGITFTYADSNVAGLFIDEPADDLALPACLSILEKKTKLKFQQLDSRFVTISKVPVHGITFCGRVVDADTKDVLPGVTIRTEKKTTITDSLGYFELEEIPETSLIIIQSMGYTPQTIIASGNAPCSVVSLAASVITLEEVVIRNFLTTGITKEADGSLSIRREDLQMLPGLAEPDVLHTLQVLPGIQSVDESVSNVNVRGGTHDQNLVLLDGIKMYQTGHFFGLITAFNPYLVQKVSLQKNGTSASLGDGTSSTILIETENTASQKLSGGAGVTLLNSDFFVRIPVTKKSSLHVASRRSLTDLVRTATYNRYFTRAFNDTDLTDTQNDSIAKNDEAFRFYDVSAKFLYDFSKDQKLRVTFLNVANDLEYGERAHGNLGDSKTSGLTQTNLGASASYEHRWNNRHVATMQGYLSRYGLKSVNFDVINDQRLIQENIVTDAGLKFDFRTMINDAFDISYGYQYFETGIENADQLNNPSYTRDIKNVVRTHAGYTEGNYHSGNTTINAGLRVNYYDKIEHIRFEPRLVFNQKLTEELLLEVLGEMKSQATSQEIDFQTDFLGIEKRRWVLADDVTIPLIKSKQVSAGLYYTLSSFLASIVGYYKTVDGITSRSQGFQNQFEFVRTNGSYNVTGIDVLVNQKFPNVSTWASYSLSHNDYYFPELTPTTFRSNLNLVHVGSMGTSYKLRQFEFAVGLNYHTGRPYTTPVDGVNIVNNEIVYQSPNSSRLSNYARLDFSGRYTFTLSRDVNGVFGVSVWNVLDRRNAIDSYYRIENPEQISRIDRRALSFTPNMMFRIQF
jgi:hypothetical protein